MTVEQGEVVRIDRDAEDREWAEERMDAFGNTYESAWSVALDLAANWFDGRNVSRLYPDPRYPEEPQPMTLAMALRAHWGGPAGPAPLDVSHSQRLANAAQVYLMAGEGYESVKPKALRPFGPPERWTPETVRATLREVEERFGRDKLDFNHVRAVIHPTTMKPPYWQQVLQNLMEGAHDLTPATARNIVATATDWLERNPDAPTRR